MIMLALNCGFGPKDLQDLSWDDIQENRVTLPRSKTGVCQTYILWPETLELLAKVRFERAKRAVRMGKHNSLRTSSIARAMASGHESTLISLLSFLREIVERHRIPLSCSISIFGSTPLLKAVETIRHVASDWAGQPPALPKLANT